LRFRIKPKKQKANTVRCWPSPGNRWLLGKSVVGTSRLNTGDQSSLSVKCPQESNLHPVVICRFYRLVLSGLALSVLPQGSEAATGLGSVVYRGYLLVGYGLRVATCP